MALNVGSRIAHYDVTALIGEGGMGQVYQATDTKLNRQVALKILPEAFASDPERLARFQREAQVLASLNHPNIAAIHGLEEADGVRALVLELVEGPTLEDRIAQGPIPVDEALPIAKQIAEAVEAAHEAGVIHRDLKPANIKVREDGTVKVLDFGLAKALDPSPEGDPSQSPTLTAAATQMGVILGTAAYMSPEQARGKPVDKRADIWAFGTVLYEMLTGQRPFLGDDVSQTLARVIESDPDWSFLPKEVPQPLEASLRLCLQKDPRYRVRDVGDVRLALEGAFDYSGAGGVPPIPEPPSRATWQRAAPLPLVMLIAGVTAGGLAVWAVRPMPDTQVDTMRFAIGAGDFAAVLSLVGSEVVISPDGSKIVYTGDSGLVLRPIDEFTGAPLRGTSRGAAPFFSPNGESVGFVDPTRRGDRLRKVSILGGPPQPLATLPNPIRGAAWGRDDQIVVGANGGGLFSVPAAGGEPEPLTTLTEGEFGHTWPSWLPDGTAVVFVVASLSAPNQLAALDLNSRNVKRLGLSGVSPHYVSTGHLVYAALDGSLLAVPFDAEQLEVQGSPVALVEGLSVRAGGAANFSISDGGRLVYQSRIAVPRSLVWVSRDGRAEPVDPGLQPDQYVYPRISPNGERIAFVISVNVEDAGSDADLWVFNLARGSRSKITFGGNNRFFPVWTPDGTQVTFADGIIDSNALRLAQADGSGQPEVLLERDGLQYPTSWAPGGQALAFYDNDPETGRDLWVLSQGAPVPFVVTPFQDRAPAFSSDGRWIAYVSDKSGRDEVYVRPYPSSGPEEHSVSVGGGVEPVWSSDGTELFYRNMNQVMVVALDTAESFRPAAPELLFTGDYDLDNSANGTGGVPNYDVSHDGHRFVMVRREQSSNDGAPREIQVVLNWDQELLERVPTGQ